MKNRVITSLRRIGFPQCIVAAEHSLQAPLNHGPSTWIGGNRNAFVVLQRWNSYSPFLARDQASLGGGYVLVWQGKVVVIDPGCHFYSNFNKKGFHLADIHAVVVTHSHIDHTFELESLYTLLHKMNRISPANRRKKVRFYLNLGTLKKHAGWLDLLHRNDENCPLEHIHILDPNKVPNHWVWIPETTIRFKSTRAIHDEIIAQDYSTGLLFELFQDKRARRAEVTIGITSDTAWQQPIQTQFNRCHLLVLHLGSIYENEFRRRNNRNAKHLGIRGCCDFLENITCRRALISEWGEELRDQRRNIMRTLRNHNLTGTIINCADIGTTVNLPDLNLSCEYPGCNNTAQNFDIYIRDNSVIHYCRYHP